jgi:hypothetical protein
MGQGNRLVNPMMAAEEYLRVFQGAKRSGNTHRGNGVDRFADRQTRQGEPSGSERVNTRPLNSGVPTPLTILFAQAAFGSPTSSTPVGGFFPQRPQCDLFSASQGVV